MKKTELESKHLAELHSLAADAGIDGYRMLPRQQLIERLAEGSGGTESQRPRGRRDEPPRRRSREGGRRQPREPRPQREAPRAPAEPPKPPEGAASDRPRRRRRRRRWGRRKKVRVHDLLLAATPGGRMILYAESREGCTALLREVGAKLSEAKGPDPVALLVDPSPEELAAWRRDAPQAEIIAAGQPHHADDAIAQASRRAESGEAVIVLVDSLSRFAEAFGGAEDARELFESGVSVAGNGSLTVVAAVERE